MSEVQVVARARRMKRQGYRAALVATGVAGVFWWGGGGGAFGQAGGRAVTPVDVGSGGGTPAAPGAAVPAAPENPTNNPPAAASPAAGVGSEAPAPAVNAQAAAATENAPISAGATDATGAAAAGGRAVTPENVAAPGSPPSAGSTPEIAPAPPVGVGATPGATTMPETASAATGPATTQGAGYVYPITGIKVNYLKESAQQPAIDQLLNTEVEMGVKDGVYVAPSQGTERVKVRLGDVGHGEVQKIGRSGITTIYGQIVHFFTARGLIGVYVVVDAKDIDANDRDIRPADRTTLQFIVVTSTVKEVRTVLTGDKVPEGERVDDPKHAWIREDSPLKANGSTSLLNKDALDEYVMRLNRQPGRRVDVAVSAAGEIGGVTLDYLISENKPWYVYAQVSNTGTKQTNEWRERFGGVDNQLTGHDDILSIDYTTAGFEASHAVIGSYDIPLFSMDRLRYKIYASYNEFTASDVGQGAEKFSGDQWVVGNELVWNIFQHRELFIDAVGGVRGQGVSTNNITAQTTGRATYVAPYLGLRLDRTTDLASTTGDVTVIGYYTGDDLKQVEALGRAQPTRSPVILQWDFAQSAYLEPLLDPNHFATGDSTLAHEVYVGFRGQYSPNRLFPQVEEVAGGFYSVRGYPESISAGDTVLVGSAEYRFHFPRILPVQADPGKTPFLWDKRFRFSPQQVYGRPDWDLIARAFFDVGQVWNSDKLQFEQDQTLAGTGVGIELQYKQNFNVRVDWGFALIDVPDQVQAGDNRVHISATFLY
ncbi:MAG TPA: ShlB/FhaC/HecB family hemolysin secretion/activation protein [Phycisphaerae bacterium]|nr:ShlB/FhaC/HecB family hemolysin secretion/activation protein [Phycisphaerae bacterium]